MQKIGTNYLGGGKCEFRIWAPEIAELFLHLLSEPARTLPLQKEKDGCFYVLADNIKPKDRYFYRFNSGLDRPDPLSHYQPEDVLGSSSVIDHSEFRWQDGAWHGTAIEKMVIYELHVGTFSKEGTFGGVIDRLSYLQELGVNAIELMPVTQFPGARNWGYDGVYPFSVQNSYGGPEGLKKLVDASHARNISVILDVVYNHLGPEGNFLAEFLPCFTDKYSTPWGKAINFDGVNSNGVRELFIQNALHWFENYHIDALRLDAIHGIFDSSAKHFLKELSERVAEFSQLKGRKYYLIAESDLNDVRTVEPYSKGGYGIDVQWNDDFHHCLHTLLTKESQGYYEDFGSLKQIGKAVKEGFVYSWDYSVFRKRYHGSSSAHIHPSKFIVFSQNHDQVGNRMKGERLSTLVNFEALKVAAGMVLLSSNIPLLFMGEEYAEESPFLYFMSFIDTGLVNAVRKGRKEEFAAFKWTGEPQDPFSEKTFFSSKLKQDKAGTGKGKVLLDFYKKLIQIRKDTPAITDPDVGSIVVKAEEESRVFTLTRFNRESTIYTIVNFGEKRASYAPVELGGKWCKILDSSDTKWSGPGSRLPQCMTGANTLSIEPMSLAVYEEE